MRTNAAFPNAPSATPTLQHAADERIGDYALTEIRHEPRSGCWTEARFLLLIQRFEVRAYVFTRAYKNSGMRVQTFR